MPRPTRKTQDPSRDAGEVPSSRRRREKWRGRASTEKKMLSYDEGSRNVHENTQKDDTLPEEKSDISAQRSDILCKNRCTFMKLSVFCHFASVGERIARFKL